MKGGAHPSPFAALSFPNSKKVPIYWWVDRASFSIATWLYGDFLHHSRAAGPRSAIGRTPDSQVMGPEIDTRSGNILSFLLPLFQEGQLSVTGESMCTKYWLTA